MIKIKNQILLTAVLTVLGIFALQIPFTRLLGANVKFTLFDFLAPTFGAFLTTVPGIFSVLLIQLVNILIHGISNVGVASIIRLFPILFGVFYFSQKRSANVVIPVIAIVAFNLHPIGRSAWQYSLMWLIPIAAHFFRKNLYIRSLGSTFTAHAVGGALWVWAFGLTREMWLALLPQSLMERAVMAGGITASYLIISKVIALLKAYNGKTQLAPAKHS